MSEEQAPYRSNALGVYRGRLLVMPYDDLFQAMFQYPDLRPASFLDVITYEAMCIDAHDKLQPILNRLVREACHD